MKNPIFAVIIPVYNGEQYISDCLNSLLQQSYKNWVAIVIDDGSKDNSLQLLQQYAHKDSRINVFTKKNEGVSKARNYALSKLENYEYDWICFLDIDDWFDPERFQNIAEKLSKYNNDQIDFIRAFSLKVKDRDMKLSLSEKLDADILSPYDYYANENVGGYMHTCLLSKELFEKYNIKFPEDMNFLEDQVFVQKYAMRATLIMCYKTKDYFYYVPNIHKKYRNFYPDILKCINYIFDDVITLETPSFRKFYENKWLREKVTLLISYLHFTDNVKKELKLPAILKDKKIVKYCNSHFLRLKYLLFHLMGKI